MGATPLTDRNDQIADVQRATALLATWIDMAATEFPADLKPRVPNAILNVAVARVLEAEGPTRTASILTRLAEAVLSGQRPRGSDDA